MYCEINASRVLHRRDPMLYGHFIEHFHRQVYPGIYDPGNPLSDEDGFREDVIEAMKRIRVPVVRWPGGCFVSSYHWKEAVGPRREASFDKAWRVEDSNAFGTDEFMKWCDKVGCAPYICFNAGTGSIEEMSDWVEYCNLESEGRYARQRIANGHAKPYGVRYWSVGNENYGWWELGKRYPEEWSRIVVEAAKLVKHVDPTVELSAAALDDVDWNVRLLRDAGEYLDWISLHAYWDGLWNVDEPADYEQVMAMTEDLERPIRRARGLLDAFSLRGRISIAFDEWNLRGWHHPHAHTIRQGRTREEYLYPRDRNDINSVYTMADAVFSACFLNTLLRNGDIVRMANYAPSVNARGLIYTHDKGLVLRPTYHVFELYANRMGDEILDLWSPSKPSFTARTKEGDSASVETLDVVATRHSASGGIAIAAVNKHPGEVQRLDVRLNAPFMSVKTHVLSGDSVDAYNGVGVNGALIEQRDIRIQGPDGQLSFELPAHSVCLIEVEQ